MAAKPPIGFKTEATLWAMLAECNPDGRSAKPFDMRRWGMADERIYRLSWGQHVTSDEGELGPRVQLRGPNFATDLASRRHWSWSPDEKEVSFVNKATGELLTFEYLGVEFTPWAPGWGFLILGKRLSPEGAKP